MPGLDSYANNGEAEPSQPPKQQPQPASEFQTTRENSREPAEDEKDMAPAPMGSLYEATQLNSLRTRLRRVNPRKRNAKRRMEADMISQNLLSIADGEELLALYVPTSSGVILLILHSGSNGHFRGTCSILLFPKKLR